MPKVVSMCKVRAVAGPADRVLFAFNNGAIVYAVAVVGVTRSFGQVALLLALLAAATGVLRGAVGTPRAATLGGTEIRREGAFAVTTALLVSPVLWVVMWAISGPNIRLSALLIMAATPIVLVADVVHHMAIAQDRAHVVAPWDGLWFAGSTALLVAAWLHLPAATADYLLGAWTAVACVALIGTLAGDRVTPSVSGYRAWLSDGWQRRVRGGTESGLTQLTVFAVLLFATVILSPEVAAALRGAAALLAPVALAMSVVPAVMIPQDERPTVAPSRVWSVLARIALATASGSLVLGVALFFLPLPIGELLLGHTFEATQAIVPIIAVGYAMAAWIVSVAVFLRTFDRGADARMLTASTALVLVGTAIGGAVLFGTAAGVATGAATGTTFVATLALLRFKPWSVPAGPSRPVRVRPAVGGSSPAGASAAGRHTAAITDHDFLNPGLPRPMPFVTRLRLHKTTPVNEALITLWIFAVMAVFVPAAIIAFTHIPPNLNWLWALPATAICSARFAWLIGTGERRLFELMYWSYAYAFLCLAPLVQLREGEWPATLRRVDSTYTAAAALMVIVGCCAFLAGAGLDQATSRRWPWQLSKRIRDVAEQVFSVNYARTVLLCGFATLLDGYYLAQVGWILFTKSRYELAALESNIWPKDNLGVIFRAGAYMGLLVAFIALMRFRQEAKRAIARGEKISTTVMRSNMTLLVFIGVLLANSMNPISNARYLSGTAMLAAATAFGLFATRWRFRLTSCGFLAGMLFIFPMADAFRVSSEGEVKSSDPIRSLLTGDYDSFAQLMNGYLIGARDGIVPGKQFSGVLLFWLPRSIWTHKPVDTGIYIANMRGYAFTNLSAPLWVEFYLNGGWIPLAVGMFALGYGLHRWDTRMNTQFLAGQIPSVLGCILPFYLMILLRGSLLQAASYLFFILVFAAGVRQKGANTRLRGPTIPARPADTPADQDRRVDYVRA
ncbi:hypothetical protein [Mycobacterium scrofulaceum]|uniref:Uncharacterized protein n=1 Tax=Mycobacterium scrofulaceum TaxID=1783 RepID=A0A1A2VY28_MYCSC|nr:hypothetical protein [Mycobacterium scrofulaceum]OBI05561.1 hypothetical protein A5679_13325 [Mycobacterium scrofulaceum]